MRMELQKTFNSQHIRWLDKCKPDAVKKHLRLKIFTEQDHLTRDPQILQTIKAYLL